MKKILILGGYGNFGKKIAEALLKEKIPVIISGRSIRKAVAYKETLCKTFPQQLIETAKIDVNQNFTDIIDKLGPVAAVNTCGPFQTANYKVVQQCIDSNISYIDLADGRNFVKNISQFNQIASNKNISVISGASTVPALSSAVVEKYKNQFSQIDQIIQGISPGQKTNRGDIATIKGVMSYVGKPFAEIPGQKKTIYGWQDLYKVQYPVVGTRLFCNCQVPDYDVLAQKYFIKNVHFSAGTQSHILHLLILMVSWMIRLGLPINLSNHAQILLKISHLFDFLGTKDGGMHIFLKGKNLQGLPIQRRWFIIAKNADGPHIPSIPAIILAKKFAKSQKVKQGAYPCAGVIKLEQYLSQLKGRAIQTYSYLN